MPEQTTIASPARLHGRGLHTGEEVRLELVPAAPGSGIVFVRTDLPGRPHVEARLENLSARPRRTALVHGAAEVHTTEHLLAALSAVGVHNLEARIDGPELPGLDGSALPFYEAVRGAGITLQGEPATEIEIDRPHVAGDPDGDSTLVAFPGGKGGLTIGYTLDYAGLRASLLRGSAPPSPFVLSLTTQFLELEINEETFAREIAPARTFVFEDEVRQLRAAGLGKGATTQNTLVLGARGVIENELRFPDELVRHKILDLLGDLYLLGRRITGRLLAVRSGHALNVQMARLLFLGEKAAAAARDRRPVEAVR
jgi:UDP-3-O-acyl N-acetylglucosamine deacetylase